MQRPCSLRGVDWIKRRLCGWYGRQLRGAGVRPRMRCVSREEDLGLCGELLGVRKEVVLPYLHCVVPRWVQGGDCRSRAAPASPCSPQEPALGLPMSVASKAPHSPIGFGAAPGSRRGGLP